MVWTKKKASGAQFTTNVIIYQKSQATPAEIVLARDAAAKLGSLFASFDFPLPTLLASSAFEKKVLILIMFLRKPHLFST